MPKRKPIHNKALRMEKQKEKARLAMRKLKVQMCVDMKMSKSEITQYCGLTQKSIDEILYQNPDLAAQHTFSLLERKEVDDQYINRQISNRNAWH